MPIDRLRKCTRYFILLLAACLPISAVHAVTPVAEVFEFEHRNQLILDIEAALAQAQASQGIIPQWAADEITAKAQLQYLPADELAVEYRKVQHRMVALLNVWTSYMEHGAGEYVHFGTTTVDVYDNALVLQLRQATRFLITDMQLIEDSLIALARAHRDTVMMGRTLGQHALPITFGKKVSGWLGENRRNIERLKTVAHQLDQSGILKGAVGSYLGLGDKALETEQLFVAQLGLTTAYPDDWHGARDVLADYALTLALISKAMGRIGNELFLLQMTDIGETQEVLPDSVVGSSTMPHKKNPKKPDALVYYSRTIPRLAEVVLDDVINSFERDSTSRSAGVLAEISIEAERMLKTADALLSGLQVNAAVMTANLSKTQGLILSQRVTFALAEHIGKTTANSLMHEVAQAAIVEGTSLGVALRSRPDITRYFGPGELDRLLEPTTYTGLDGELVDRVISWCLELRKSDP
ncbi:MAG: lyase family protein [Pseudomonadales bacterium]